MHFWGNYYSNLYNWHCFLVFGFSCDFYSLQLWTHIWFIFIFFNASLYTLFLMLAGNENEVWKKIVFCRQLLFLQLMLLWPSVFFFICRASRDELLKVCSNVLCAMLMRAYEDASTTHVSSSSSSSSTVHNLIKLSQRAKLKRRKEKGKEIFADN